MKWGYAASIAAAIALLPLLSMRLFVSDVVVEHLQSPSETFLATVHEINGGATTDFLYRVEVQRRGFGWYHQPQLVFGGWGTASGNCAGVNLRWLDDHTLDISYLTTRDNRKPFIAERPEMDGEPLWVRVRSGVTDPRAPCGGVEHNQK